MTRGRALIDAALRGDAAEAMELLRGGADPAHYDAGLDLEPLSAAAFGGNLELLDEIASRLSLEAGDSSLDAALESAARSGKGSLGCALRLLDWGAWASPAAALCAVECDCEEIFAALAPQALSKLAEKRIVGAKRPKKGSPLEPLADEHGSFEYAFYSSVARGAFRCGLWLARRPMDLESLSVQAGGELLCSLRNSGQWEPAVAALLDAGFKPGRGFEAQWMAAWGAMELARREEAELLGAQGALKARGAKRI